MSVRPITYFYGNMFGKKVISEVLIVVIFDDRQSKTWRDDCPSTLENLWTKLYGAPTEMKSHWQRFFQGAIIYFLVLNFCIFFLWLSTIKSKG